MIVLMVNRVVECNQEMIVLLKELADSVTEEKKQQVDNLIKRVRCRPHDPRLDAWLPLTKRRP